MGYVSKLPPIGPGKVIPRNFGSIKHIAGSKQLDKGDSRAGDDAQRYCTVELLHASDRVICSEKIDGMNAGAYKDATTGYIHPVTRTGYDSRRLGAGEPELRFLGYMWTKWVNDNYDLLDSVLKPGERLVFENSILKHTLAYEFKGSPVFLLAKYNSYNKRVIHSELKSIEELGYGKWRLPRTIWNGEAVPVANMLTLLNSIGSESLNGPEGVVYKYESNGKHMASIKFVSNTSLVPGAKGRMPTELNKFNTRYFDPTFSDEVAQALGLTDFWAHMDYL